MMRPINLAVVFPHAPTAVTLPTPPLGAVPSRRGYKKQTEVLGCSSPLPSTQKAFPHFIPSSGATLRRAAVLIPVGRPAAVAKESGYSPSLLLTPTQF